MKYIVYMNTVGTIVVEQADATLKEMPMDIATVGANLPNKANIAEAVALMLNRELRLAWPLVIERYYADYEFGGEQSTPCYFERLFFATEQERDDAIEAAKPFVAKLQSHLENEIRVGNDNGAPCLIQPDTLILRGKWQDDWLKDLVEGYGEWDEAINAIEANELAFSIQLSTRQKEALVHFFSQVDRPSRESTRPVRTAGEEDYPCTLEKAYDTWLELPIDTLMSWFKPIEDHHGVQFTQDEISGIEEEIERMIAECGKDQKVTSFMK